MTYIAIQEKHNGEVVSWLKHATDDEYAGSE